MTDNQNISHQMLKSSPTQSGHDYHMAEKFVFNDFLKHSIKRPCPVAEKSSINDYHQDDSLSQKPQIFSDQKPQHSCEQYSSRLSSNKLIKLKHKDTSESEEKNLDQRNQTRISNIVYPTNTNNYLHETVSSKHLVRTISDFPVFVTIEGFRIASYMIDGEAHLCLPQLLLYMKQEFQLDEVVEIFEESGTNFTSATEKQVEGFIKSYILPPSAKSCSLIRRSAADRACLRLFDRVSHAQRGYQTYGTYSSKRSRPESDSGDTKQSTVSNSDVKGIDDQEEPTSDPTEDSQNASCAYENNQDRFDPIMSDQVIVSSRFDQSDSETNKNLNSQVLNHREPANIRAQRYQVSKRTESKPDLFESEAQTTILNLARAVTSTLMIQVYHKCFGKCSGFYYPSLLKDSNSHCIECASCSVLLSPRRFIGHMHGVEEINVCHWGFNSYNWRHYIRLSKRQSMNKLYEDELLVKFERLISIPEAEICIPEVDNASNSTISKSALPEDSRQVIVTNYSAIKDPSVIIAQASREINPFFINALDSKLDNRTSDRQSQIREFPNPRVEYAPSTSCAATINDSIRLESPTISEGKYNHHSMHSTFSNPLTNPLELLALNPACHLASHIDTSMAKTSCSDGIASTAPSSSTVISLPELNGNPFHHESYGTSTSSTFSIRSYYPGLDTTSHSFLLNSDYNHHLNFPIGNNRYSYDQDVPYIQRVKFVSSNLTNYLSSRNTDAELAKDIVTYTLDLIHKSRALF